MRWSLCLAALLAVATVADASDSDDAFEGANQLYEQGRFDEASAAYEKMLAGGHASAAVYFNLGNALFKAGRTGRAIANYRVAEQLAPRDADIRANLQFARNRVEGGGYQSSGRWRAWLARLTLDEWTTLATGAFWIWLALLTVGQWRPGVARAMRGYTATAGAIALLLIACLGSSVYAIVQIQSAVVVSPEAVVHYGPYDDSPKKFNARDGAELTVTDRKDDWLQVMDGANRTGWLRRNQVVILSGWKQGPSSST